MVMTVDNVLLLTGGNISGVDSDSDDDRKSTFILLRSTMQGYSWYHHRRFEAQVSRDWMWNTDMWIVYDGSPTVQSSSSLL